MNGLATFLHEPLGRMMWLAIAAVLLLTGFGEVGGGLGLAIAMLAIVPVLLMLTGGRPLMRLLARVMPPRPREA